MSLEIENKLNNGTPNIWLTVIRSEPMEEIISRKPRFITRFALLLFASLLLLLLLSSWYIHYPDTIIIKAKLIGLNVPKEITTAKEGKLVHLVFRNNDSIGIGRLIGWVESNANYLQVIKLSKKLDSAIANINANKPDTSKILFQYDFSGLGELQETYLKFMITYQQFQDYFVNGFYSKKAKGLEKYLSRLQGIRTNLKEQENIQRQRLTWTQGIDTTDESLYTGRTSLNRFRRNAVDNLLENKTFFLQIETNMLYNDTQQRQIFKEIADIVQNTSHQKLLFLLALEELKDVVNDWKRTYLVVAPVSGKFILTSPIEENNYIEGGRVLGYINPTGSKYYAEAIIPLNNFNEINSGQKVDLRFDAYPYNEFGYVRGRLKYVSPIPTDSGYIATIELPSGLKTNNGKNIQYQDGLKVEAMIITKDIRLLERVFHNIFKY